MAATTNGADLPKNKTEAVRRILASSPNASGKAIADAVKAQFGMDMTAKHAMTCRLKIRAETGKKKSGKKRGRPAKQSAPVAAVAAAPVAAVRPTTRAGNESGVDDLLSAAQKLGWQRVKELVDGVIKAPK